MHTGVGEDALGDVKVNSGEAKPQQATGSPTKLRALFRAVGVVNNKGSLGNGQSRVEPSRSRGHDAGWDAEAGEGRSF